MQNQATLAGIAAPTPLPKYELPHVCRGYALRIYAKHTRPDVEDDTAVCLSSDDTGVVSFCKWLTAAEARLLAVYLVDCANAVDNPAQRVIVDAGEGIGHE